MMRAVVHEIVGLFVDDGFLAAALLAWIAAVAALGAFLVGPSPVLALVFAAGCIVILLGAIVRTARR